MKNPEIILEGKFPKFVRLRNEWFEEPGDPEEFIEDIKRRGLEADILTFRQLLPATEPKYDHYFELDPLAVIPVTSYDQWFTSQIKSSVRSNVRKSVNRGVETRVEEFNDDLINGIVDLVNDTRIRQDRKYTYFGYNFEQIKETFAPGPYYCEYIGAYYENKLIGFIKLLFAGKCSHNFGMISKVEHKDKVPQYALISKSIERTAQRKTPYLLYGQWVDGGLGQFKRHIGCQLIEVPKYYIPLSAKGKILLNLNLHHGLKHLVPKKISNQLKSIRKKIRMVLVKH
jgi:hypothetical protein